MPMHDWTRVKAGTYHNYHYRWLAAIMDRLNAGLLPPGYFAMAEQIIGRPKSDVVTLQTGPSREFSPHNGGSVAVAVKPPKTSFVLPIPSEAERYARRANRIAIHHDLGNVVTVIEIVSPGNKDRRHAFRTFVEKAVDLIVQDVNLLIIDPFPPGPHDPQGIHKAVWDEFTDQDFALPTERPLTFVAYQVLPVKTAYVEPIGVGQRLPDMPLFLEDEQYVWVPLEETYRTTWNVLPSEIRKLVED